MSQSLALKNGDLAITSGRAFQVVKNQDKLIQDLRLWILEHFGESPGTPEYGSNLDAYIGSPMGVDLTNQVQAEILRVLQQYQTMQVQNMQRDTIAYAGSTTLDPHEVIESIDGLLVQSVGTMLLITISLSTLAEQQLQLSIPIAAPNA
jgi:phage baseplate assembly protein W